MQLSSRALTQHAQSPGFNFQHHKTSKYELYGVRGHEYFISVPLALSPRPDGEGVAGRSVNPWVLRGTQRASGWESSWVMDGQVKDGRTDDGQMGEWGMGSGGCLVMG